MSSPVCLPTCLFIHFYFLKLAISNYIFLVTRPG
jgi:hypothetical protein